MTDSKDKGFLNGEHHSRWLTVLSLFPFTLMTVLIILSLGTADLVWATIIPTWGLLFVIGFGASSANKRWNLVAFISQVILMVGSIAIGYYEYLQWTSTKVGFGLTLFFSLIFMIQTFLNHKNLKTVQS